MSDPIQIGLVRDVVITTTDGKQFTIDNAIVSVSIQENYLEHTGLTGERKRFTINRQSFVNLGVEPDVYFNAIRLIRED